MTHAINFREQDSIRPRLNPWLVLLLGLIGTAGGCASNGQNMTGGESACLLAQETDRKIPPTLNNADDYLTVDCLLPGQPIHLGNMVWMGPPTPAIISAWQCNVQGGQYAIGHNRDARQMAVNVWQQCADQGDKVAQNYLGEIYAKQWGNVKPDFTRAAEWFRKAAEQGYSRAQNNLSVLFEQGLGVPKDPKAAFNLHRQATGPVAPVSLDSNTKEKIQDLSQKLDATEQKVKTLQQQLQATEQHLQQKQDELEQVKKGTTSQNNEEQIRALKKALEEERLSKQKISEQLSDLQQKFESDRKQLGNAKTRAALGNMAHMGTYYALIIGINGYQSPPGQLETPVNDARRIESILKSKYGFQTELLTDDSSTKPTEEGIIKKLMELAKKLTDNDNLLIYYAGHGKIRNNEYHWLPQDAAPDNVSRWISTNDITKQIELSSMKARHVLIVADSCYAGMLTTRGGSEDLIDPSPEYRVGFINKKADLVSRNALTSGNLEPVLDKDGGNGLSIFANAFYKALERNSGIIGANDVYRDIGPEVSAKAQQSGWDQTPVFGSIPFTDDNGGEFFFVSRSSQGIAEANQREGIIASEMIPGPDRNILAIAK